MSSYIEHTDIYIYVYIKILRWWTTIVVHVSSYLVIISSYMIYTWESLGKLFIWDGIICERYVFACDQHMIMYGAYVNPYAFHIIIYERCSIIREFDGHTLEILLRKPMILNWNCIGTNLRQGSRVHHISWYSYPFRIHQVSTVFQLKFKSWSFHTSFKT